MIGRSVVDAVGNRGRGVGVLGHQRPERVVDPDRLGGDRALDLVLADAAVVGVVVGGHAQAGLGEGLLLVVGVVGNRAPGSNHRVRGHVAGGVVGRRGEAIGGDVGLRELHGLGLMHHAVGPGRLVAEMIVVELAAPRARETGAVSWQRGVFGGDGEAIHFVVFIVLDPLVGRVGGDGLLLEVAVVAGHRAVVEGPVEGVGGLVGAVGRGPRAEALDGGLEAVIEAVLLGEQIAELTVDDLAGGVAVGRVDVAWAGGCVGPVGASVGVVGVVDDGTRVYNRGQEGVKK